MPISAFLHRCRPHRRTLFLILAPPLLGDLLWTLGRFPALHHQQIYRAEELPAVGGPVLVLGAGVYGDGEPTELLQGRLRTALNLYQNGKVRWFLVSGDNRHPSYNEPQAMRRAGETGRASHPYRERLRGATDLEQPEAGPGCLRPASGGHRHVGFPPPPGPLPCRPPRPAGLGRPRVHRGSPTSESGPLLAPGIRRPPFGPLGRLVPAGYQARPPGTNPGRLGSGFVRDPQDLLILAAGRLPQGRYGGSLAGLGAVPLGLSAVEGLLSHPALPQPGSLIWGMARSHTQGMNPARTIALKAGLPHDTPAFTVNMACGSSLQALIIAAQRLRDGAKAPILVGGSEAMSDTPHLVPGLRWGFRMGHRQLPDVMHHDGLRCPVTGLLMGETIERLAAKRGITRLEADDWAVESHRRAASADFQAEQLPHPRLDHDESIRPEITVE